ncbi:32220_t:CDS:1, partial [Racocetra persica]
ARKSNNISATINFTNVISQVRHNDHLSEPNNTNLIPINTKHNDSSDTDNNTISPPSLHTRKEVDVSPINYNDPITI